MEKGILPFGTRQEENTINDVIGSNRVAGRRCGDLTSAPIQPDIQGQSYGRYEDYKSNDNSAYENFSRNEAIQYPREVTETKPSTENNFEPSRRYENTTFSAPQPPTLSQPSRNYEDDLKAISNGTFFRNDSLQSPGEGGSRLLMEKVEPNSEPSNNSQNLSSLAAYPEGQGQPSRNYEVDFKAINNGTFFRNDSLQSPEENSRIPSYKAATLPSEHNFSNTSNSSKVENIIRHYSGPFTNEIGPTRAVPGRFGEFPSTNRPFGPTTYPKRYEEYEPARTPAEVESHPSERYEDIKSTNNVIEERKYPMESENR
ncbi:unnamed protein product [Cylicostephanus goldi]|uniref:Uncharacterized protein n=1 Tax=Cylicostephanus goldi TaxID=71465 RepID=A0A3P6R7K3_CYLGO|nr:unnamed protein product [Cylicostephanus goldi]